MLRLLCALFLAAPLAFAQAQLPSVGERVRLTLYEAQPQPEKPAARRLILRGELTRVDGDSLYLRPSALTGELGISRAAVRSLHRSRGVTPRGLNALRWGLFGAFEGAVALGVMYDPRQRDYGVINRGEAIALGASVGAISGAVWGALLPAERWKRVKAQ
jgi:hypothetical protein